MHEKHMKRALELATEAAEAGEVPIGALVVLNGEVIAEARNQKEEPPNPAGHAEILVIQKAAEKLGRWRLSDCELYVTLEPCLMCSGAIISARFKSVIFAAKDPKAGAVVSLYETLNDSRLNHQCEVVEGVCADESSQLLKKFFSQLR